MTELIQKFLATDVVREHARWAFIVDAADLYGRGPAVHRCHLVGLDDVTALRAAFPGLSDPEIHEAAWALGQATDRF